MSRLAFRPFDPEGDDVFPGILVVMQGMLLSRGLAISKIPFPRRDAAFGEVFEGDNAPALVQDLEGPLGLDGFAELRFQRQCGE